MRSGVSWKGETEPNVDGDEDTERTETEGTERTDLTGETKERRKQLNIFSVPLRLLLDPFAPHPPFPFSP